MKMLALLLSLLLAALLMLGAPANAVFMRNIFMRGICTGGCGGVPPQTLVWINPNNLSFQAQAGNANQVLAKLTPGMWPASSDFSGTCTISSGDASLFILNSSTYVLSIGAADITTSRSYTFNAVCTAAGIRGSPYTQAITVNGLHSGTFTRSGTTVSGQFQITGLSSTADIFPGTVVFGTNIPAETTVLTVDSSSQVTMSGNVGATGSGTQTLTFQSPYVTVSNFHPNAGATVTVTVHNAYNLNGLDYWQLKFPADSTQNNTLSNPWRAAFPGANNGGFTPYSATIGAGVHDATFTLTMPTGPSDNNTYYEVLIYLNNGFTISAYSGWITVPPTMAHVAPVAANTLSAPWVPAHVLTVCPSGCAYTTPSAAIAAAVDFDQVLVSAGAYVDCSTNSGTPSPPHLWIKGTGGDFPMWGWKLCSSQGVLVWGTVNGTPGSPILYVDNMGFGDWPAGGNGNGAAVRNDGCGDLVFRNVYIHDGTMGILTGEAGCTALPINVTISNSHFARNGGNTGPSHNIYIGGSGGFNLTVSNTLSEQTNNGHELKTRAIISNVTCSYLLGTRDDTYIDSELTDFAEGREDHVHSNLFVKGGRPGLESTQQSEITFWRDHESPTLANNFLDMQDNVLINDDSDNLHNNMWFMDLLAPGVNFTPSPPYPLPFVAGHKNVFIAPFISGGTIHDWHAFYETNSSTSDSTVFTDNNTGNDFLNRAAAFAAGAITSNSTLPVPAACVGQTIGNLAVP